MTKEVTVESFELDHAAVIAPYVRLISEEEGPVGDVISNFDVRLVQPNHNAIETSGLHTHSLESKNWQNLNLESNLFSFRPLSFSS